MDITELLAILARGEDSRHQFKVTVTNIDALAAEMTAFANSAGGWLFLGVEDDGQIKGLTGAAVSRINQLVSNAASQHIKPPLNPLTNNISTPQGIVMAISIPAGINKPYVDNQGRIWVKSGADKRHVTAREEMQRLFQQSGLVYADEIPVPGTNLADIDHAAFSRYFYNRFEQTVAQTGLSLPQLLENMNLARGGTLTLAGLMLFGTAPQVWRGAFVIKAVALPGIALADQAYLDSEDIDGPLPEQYRRTLAFLKRNLHHIQGEQGFNSLGQLEIPLDVIEEVLVNALVHRDYFTSAPIRVLVFRDRVEVISPGALPNSLEVEQIAYGLSNMRNPMLTSHAVRLLPYRGLGSGIPRVLHRWPQARLISDSAANQFTAILPRPQPAV